MIYFKYLWMVMLIIFYAIWTINIFMSKKKLSKDAWYDEFIFWLFLNFGLLMCSSFGYFLISLVKR